MKAPGVWWGVWRCLLLITLFNLPFSAQALLLGQTLKVATLACNNDSSGVTTCTTSQLGSFTVNGTNSLSIGGGASVTANDTQIIFSAPAGFSTPSATYNNSFDYFVYDDNPARPKISSVYTYKQVGGAGGNCSGVIGNSLLTNSSYSWAPGLNADLTFRAACPLGSALVATFTISEAVTMAMSLTAPSSLAAEAPALYSGLIQNTDAVFGLSSLVSYVQMPSGFQFGGIAPNTQGTVAAQTAQCTASGQLLTCTLTLPAGGMQNRNGSVGFDLTLMPQPSAVNSSVVVKAAVDPNGANAAMTPSSCTANGSPAGCAVTAAQVVGSNIHLGLNKRNPVSLAVGAVADYSFTVSNSGSQASGSTVLVYDQLPANVQYASATALSSGSVTPDAVTCISSGALSTGLLLTCTVNLTSARIPANGGTADFSINVTPQPAASGTNLGNKAILDVDGYNAAKTPSSCVATGNPAGCAVTSALTVGNGVALSLAKSNPTALNVGALASYGLVLTNNGTASTTQSPLTLSDQLPPNVQYTSFTVVTPAGGSTLTGSTTCSATGTVAAGQLVTCSLYTPTGGIPANGGQVGLNLNVTPQAAALGTSVSNKAAVDANGKNAAQTPSACTANGQPAAGCAVTPALSVGKVQLALSKSNPASLSVGDPQDYSFTLSNSGSVASNSTVVVTDQLPTNLQYTAATPLSLASAVSCTAVGQVLTCSVSVPGGSGPDAGSCSVTLTATVAGSYAVTASLGGTALGGTNPVTGVFVAGTATASASRVVLSAGPKTANGVDAYTLTASALDAQGNLNTTAAVAFNFSAPGAGATLSASNCTTVAGTCSVTVTATVAGSYAITATTGGVPVGGTNPVTAVFVAGLPSASASRVTISAGPKLANGVDAYTITVLAQDATGNLSTGSATVFSFSAPGSGAALSASNCATALSGPDAGTCSVTLTATVAGSYAVTASLGGTALGGTNPVTGVFVAGTATASASRVALSAGPKTANGVDAYTLTASALDAQGNLNTTAAVAFNFSAPGAGATLSASNCTTATSGAAAGTCSVTVTATVAGSYAITATTGGVPVGGTNPVTAVFVAGLPSASASRVTISAGPKLANGTDAYTITATAYDVQGNLSSFNGTTFSFSDPGAGATASALQCVTALSGPDAGTCTVTLTATVAGSYAVTASLGGTALGGTNPVTGVFVAGAVTASASRVVLSAGPKTANGVDAYTLTASALDAQGNLNTTAATTFNFSAPGAGATLSASSCTTATSGAAAGTCSVTVTATVAGSYAITATTGGVPVGGSNPVAAVFVAATGPATQYRLNLDNPGRVRLADGRDAYVLTAGVYDASGRLNVSQAWAFDFILSIGTATGRRVVSRFVTLNQNPDQWIAMSEGRCTAQVSGPQAGTCSVTVTATLAGWFTVEARLVNPPDPGMAPAQAAAQFAAGPALASRSVLQISDGVRRADGQDAHTVTVTARDVAGNVQGDSPTVFVFDAPGLGSALSALSCTTATSGPQAGSCSVVLTATTPGSYAIAASLGGAAVNTVSGGRAVGTFVSPTGPDVTPVPMLHPLAWLGLILGLPGLAWATHRRSRERMDGTGFNAP